MITRLIAAGTEPRNFQALDVRKQILQVAQFELQVFPQAQLGLGCVVVRMKGDSRLLRFAAPGAAGHGNPSQAREGCPE